MPQLHPSEVEGFLDRFNSFHDALLRKIEISYVDEGRTVTLWLAARDSRQPANHGWVTVRFFVLNVQDFCFADAANTTAVVLSHGLHVCSFGEVMGLDLSYLLEMPEALHELKTSKGFVTGAAIEWALEPY